MKISNYTGFTKNLVNGNVTEDSITSSLIRLGIICADEHISEYREIFGWQASGETYYGAASVKTCRGERAFIAKAIITIPVDYHMETRVKRRGLLKKLGVSVPRLYSYGNGCIYLEFIPYSVRNVELTDHLMDRMAFIAAKLDENGFPLLSFVSDLRTDDEYVYFTDFGFDLGDPTGKPTNRARRNLMQYVPENRKPFIEERYKHHLN